VRTSSKWHVSSFQQLWHLRHATHMRLLDGAMGLSRRSKKGSVSQGVKAQASVGWQLVRR